MGSGFSKNPPDPREPSKLSVKINDHIYELYTPKGGPQAVKLEIVFFHGLNYGSTSEEAYLTTWTNDNKVLWPKTWLSEEFPQARILSVSYDSFIKQTATSGRHDLYIIAENLMQDIGTAGVGQSPGSPVFLVGHCLGGLVIKELCVQANHSVWKNEKMRIFLDNLGGVFFYGTPHRGTNLFFDDKFLSKLLDGPLLKCVKTLNKRASRLDQDFLDVCHDRDLPMASVGESHETKILGMVDAVIVPEASARHESYLYTFAADHISICKPTSKICNRFQLLSIFIRGIEPEILKENHVDRDRDLCKQITKGLSDAMVNEAVNPARLGLRRDDVPGLLRSYFIDISSPEKVEEILYENLFIRENYKQLLDYIKNRSATTNSIWNTYYEMGERRILRSADEQFGKTFSEPGCLFERLKAATEEWFRQNARMKKEPICNLLKDLKKRFEFVDNPGLLALGYNTIDEVNPSLIIDSWPEASKIIDNAKKAVRILVDGLRDPIKNSSYGCSELCPYCCTKCMHPADHVVSHECHRHLIRGFGGCYSKGEKGDYLCSVYCTGDAFDYRWRLLDDSKLVSFEESIIDRNQNISPGWKIEREFEDAKLPPREQRKAFKILNQRIADHFGLRAAEKVGW